MKAFKPLNRRLAIVLALVGMWLFACIGILFEIHSGDRLFLGLHGHDANTIEQIGLFFMAWTATQFPAAYFAGGIIGLSDFSHPLRTTFWTMAGYQLFFSVIRAVQWPWMKVPDLDQLIPVLAHLISAFLLIGNSVFSTWLMPKCLRVIHRCIKH
jgi:hypothetical protein